MKEGIPKISVLIICYKQEELIKRAIDSLLVQKDYLYEICVSDDCSPDNTWNVLLDYRSRYPELIKLNRNEPNVGIFENIERNWEMPTGDIVYQMAGDDEAVDGYFKSIIEFISEKNIDYKNELFCIYGDYMVKYPNGDSIIYHNSAVEEFHDVFRLALRGRICNRSACYSIHVLKLFDKVSQGRSHIVEHVQDRQLQLYAQKNYYIPCVGNIYYANIGISVHINDTIRQERLGIWPFTLDYLKNKGVQLCKSDINCIKLNMLYAKQRYGEQNVFDFIMRIWYRYGSKDKSFPQKRDRLKKIVFALRRRLPHKQSIHFD